MARGEYTPAGSEPVKQRRRDQALRMAHYDAQRREERDEAGKELRNAIAELGQLGVEMVQFEIVKPLGRLATLSQVLNPRQINRVIRADTIYSDINYYARRHALLLPRKGYLLPPTDKPREGQLREALFPDGTTGNVMRWGPYTEGCAVCIGFSPPSEAYRCNESGSVKFSPHDPDDRFEPRNCIPVWSKSLQSLSDHYGSHSIESLTNRVHQLIVLSQAEQIIDTSQ